MPTPERERTNERDWSLNSPQGGHNLLWIRKQQNEMGSLKLKRTERGVGMKKGEYSLWAFLAQACAAGKLENLDSLNSKETRDAYWTIGNHNQKQKPADPPPKKLEVPNGRKEPSRRSRMRRIRGRSLFSVDGENTKRPELMLQCFKGAIYKYL